MEQEGYKFASGLIINYLFEPEFGSSFLHMSNCNNAFDSEYCHENYNTWQELQKVTLITIVVFIVVVSHILFSFCSWKNHVHFSAYGRRLINIIN